MKQGKVRLEKEKCQAKTVWTRLVRIFAALDLNLWSLSPFTMAVGLETEGLSYFSFLSFSFIFYCFFLFSYPCQLIEVTLSECIAIIIYQYYDFLSLRFYEILE